MGRNKQLPQCGEWAGILRGKKRKLGAFSPSQCARALQQVLNPWLYSSGKKISSLQAATSPSSRAPSKHQHLLHPGPDLSMRYPQILVSLRFLVWFSTLGVFGVKPSTLAAVSVALFLLKSHSWDLGACVSWSTQLLPLRAQLVSPMVPGEPSRNLHFFSANSDPFTYRNTWAVSASSCLHNFPRPAVLQPHPCWAQVKNPAVEAKPAQKSPESRAGESSCEMEVETSAFFFFLGSSSQS